MPIHTDSCAELETIVVKTRSSVYELVVLGGDRGDVLLRGGRHFKEFRRVLFLGSTAEGGSLQPRTIDIGLRMRFIVADGLFVTSAVESLSRHLASAASPECAQRSQPGVLNATSKNDAHRGDAQHVSAANPIWNPLNPKPAHDDHARSVSRNPTTRGHA
jgi:hypothetical protein